MNTYNVKKVRENEVTQGKRKDVKDGVYAVESGNGLVYIDQEGRLKHLRRFDRSLKIVYKVTEEDISKIYNLYHTPSGYSFDDTKNLGSERIARLVVYNKKMELRDIETQELLDPDEYGIFATSEFDVIRPTKKSERENIFRGIIDMI